MRLAARKQDYSLILVSRKFRTENEMIGHFNFKELNDEYLITNDFGRFAFVSSGEFRELVNGCFDLSSEKGERLREDGFVFEGSELEYITRYAPYLRSMKKPLFVSTALHIFVVATACNLDCVYCQAHDIGAKPSQLMSEATIERAIDIALNSPNEVLTFEFQGGEPLLNYPVIKHAVEYTEEHRGEKRVDYSVVSNLSLLTDEMVGFFAEHGVGLSTSLDGPQAIHDGNRPLRGLAGSSYEMMSESLGRAHAAGLRVGGIQTTTRTSLNYAKEIVDTYCNLGFNSVFVRPLTPLGVARSRWNIVGYTPQEFGAFYREVLAAILEKGSQGIQMREGHASIMLEKAWYGNAQNYMEMRSPCGAGVGQMAYHVNGDVFTCDEGRMLYEMGDASFKLGNVFDNGYTDLISASACRATCAASTLESVPSCCDCAYQPYCGICPVVNFAADSDLLPKTPHGYHCGVYMQIFDAIFDIIHRNDAREISVLKSWFV